MRHASRAAFMRGLWTDLEVRSRNRRARGQHHHWTFDRKPFEDAMSAIPPRRSPPIRICIVDRAHSQGSMSFDLVALNQDQPPRRLRGRGEALTSRPRASFGCCRSGGACLDGDAQCRCGRHPRGADLERRQRAEPRLGRCPQGARIRQAPGPLESEAEPAAEPHSSLHQSASQELLAEILRPARRGPEHVAQPRRRGSGPLRVGRRAARGDRALPARLRRVARGPDHDHADLRERGAQAGARRWPGSMPSSRAQSAAAMPCCCRRSENRARRSPPAWWPPTPSISRSLRCRRRGAPEHRDRRADHPGDDRSRREQPAAHGTHRAGAARRRVPRRVEVPLRAVRGPGQFVEDRDRRQSGHHDRGGQQAVRADDAARAAGAGQLRPHACQYLSRTWHWSPSSS